MPGSPLAAFSADTGRTRKGCGGGTLPLMQSQFHFIGLGNLPPAAAVASVALMPSAAQGGASLTWSMASPLTTPAVAATTTSQVLLPNTSRAGFSLSPASEPFPKKLVDKIRSGQFVEMRELLTDNISLIQQLEAFGLYQHFREFCGQVSGRYLHCKHGCIASLHTRPYELQTKTHGTGLLMLACLFGRPRGMAAQAGLTMTGCSASRWHSTIACDGTLSIQAFKPQHCLVGRKGQGLSVPCAGNRTTGRSHVPSHTSSSHLA